MQEQGGQHQWSHDVGVLPSRGIGSFDAQLLMLVIPVEDQCVEWRSRQAYTHMDQVHVHVDVDVDGLSGCCHAGVEAES